MVWIVSACVYVCVCVYLQSLGSVDEARRLRNASEDLQSRAISTAKKIEEGLFDWVVICWHLSSGRVAASTRTCCPSPPLDNIRVMVIVWRLRGSIIRTALCWTVWHNVHSQQHIDMSSSYRSNRLGLSHWYPYAVRKGGCLELYYCNLVE